jgi:F-type H+-transporting ATPase subunit c
MKKLLLVTMALGSSALVFAEQATQAAAASSNDAMFAISAGLAIGIAALGGALGQARIGSAAMDGIARNPQARQDMFVPMIIGLALIESLVIYALVIAFQIVGKIG